MIIVTKIFVSFVILTVGTLRINKWFKKAMKNCELYSEVNVPVFDTPVVSYNSTRRRRKTNIKKSPVMRRKTGKGRHK